MSKTKILVATMTLSGGLAGAALCEVAGGEELTEAKAEALGLDEAGLADLLARGMIAEVDVRTAEAGAKGDAKALAAAVKRADAAEAKVAELEAKLAAATKPAA